MNAKKILALLLGAMMLHSGNRSIPLRGTAGAVTARNHTGITSGIFRLRMQEAANDVPNVLPFIIHNSGQHQYENKNGIF